MTTSTKSYEFTRGLGYQAVVAASERVAWTVDGVFAGRRFDPWRPIVPDSWVGADELPFLDAHARRTLNHCRAFSYVHLLGNFEEFVPLHLAGVLQGCAHGERSQLRALLRFGEEEVKHQQLFARAEQVLEESCGHRFGRYFDADKSAVTVLTDAILDHDPLARFLIVLALEWGTQRHYVESMHERSEERGDPLYADILRAHWIEEAQHTKSDMLEIARRAAGLRPAQLDAVFDELLQLGGLVDAVLAGQVETEIETVERCTGRFFSSGQRTALRAALHASLSAILAGVGLGHPSFAKVVRELSADGAVKLGLA